MRQASKVTAISLIMFGLLSLISSVCGYFLHGGTHVDLFAGVVVIGGVLVARGSARAAKWSTVLMGLYVLVAFLMIVVALIRPSLIYLDSQPAVSHQVPKIIAGSLVVAAWAVFNLVLLARFLRRQRQNEP